jgi:2-dehydropantoate 2-reductase
VNNAGLNSVSVLRRTTIKPMVADSGARAEVRALMLEALRVGQAMKVVSDVDVDARIDYAARLDDVKTSMLQDYERGRPLELDPILGSVIELAQRHGIDVPRLRAAYAALQQRSPQPSPR